MISKNQIKFVQQLEQKKYRKREGLFVAEGTKTVDDLLERYCAKIIYATQDWQEAHRQEAIVLTDEELRRISFQKNPQQVLAVFPIPQYRFPNAIESTLSLALDGIQDPGNLGTIIRIADWFGIDNIFCSEDTVDVWNPKVIQATMGSIARVNIFYTDLELLIDSLSVDCPVYGTFLDGTSIYSNQLSANGLIVMGNEGNGISEAVGKKINRRLLIPDFHKGKTADSLNVAIATAITCSEFRRRNI